MAKSRMEGLKELNQLLKAMPKKIAERDANLTVGAAARYMRKEVRAQAPDGSEHRQTERNRKHGPLKKQIKVRRISRKNRSRSLLAEAAVHTGEAYWSYFLEYGLKKRGGYPLNPFFTRAFDMSARPTIQVMVKDLVKRIPKTATELSGRYRTLKRATRRRL